MRKLLDLLRGSRPRTPVTPYDPEDIRAARASASPALPDFDRESSAAKLADQILSFLASKEAPGVDDPLFHLAAPRNRSLEVTFFGGESFLVAFTSLERLNHYRAATPGLSRAPWTVTLSASDLDEVIPELAHVGLAGFILDPCPYCPATNVLPASALSNPTATLHFWAAERQSRNDLFERFLDKAREALAADRAKEALRIGQHIVTHLDAERPEVHLLLGECGVRLGDKKLVDRKLEILRSFGEPWPSRLQEIARR